MCLAIYILEAKAISSGSLSARTSRLKQHGTLATQLKAYELFKSKDDFKTSMVKIMRLAHKSPLDTHMLIISSHGVPLTGTVLETEQGDHIDFSHPDIANFFTILPPNLLIWISACWGGYPAIVERMRASNNVPVIIGPLVPISGDHAITFQNQLIDLLISSGIDENQLELVTNEFNDKQKAGYFENPVRFVARSGRSVPPIGQGGLAALVEDRAKFQVIAVQGARHGDPVHVILQNGSSKWLSSSAPFFISHSPWCYLSETVSLRYQAVSPRFGCALRHLNVIGNIHMESTPRTREAFPYAYSHCSEFPSSFSETPHEFSSQEADCPCYACNWAELSLGSGAITAVFIKCYRETCPKHV